MYIKNQVHLRSNKVENCYFKFIDWFYISKFVGEFTPFLNSWKVSKYGVIHGPYFPVFGPAITPHLDTFHAVLQCNMEKNEFSNTLFLKELAWIYSVLFSELDTLLH